MDADITKHCANFLTQLYYPQTLLQHAMIRKNPQQLNPIPSRTITQTNYKNIFMLYLTPSSDLPLDFAKIMTWLKEHTFVGGGSKNTLQGSASKVDDKFINEFKQWLSAF